VFSRQVTGVPGDPDNPVTLETIEAKFRDCIAFSASPLAQANVERAVALVRDLEKVSDVSEIMRRLAPDD
jgi:2-methylcitrate dehydratase PrpD